MGGERMIRPHQGAEAFRRRGEHGDVVVAGFLVGEDEVDAVLQEVGQHGARGADRDREADARMLALERRDRMRHEVDRGQFGRPDGDVAAHQALQRLDLVADAVEIAQGAPHMGREGFAGRRQPHPALQPVEQDGADLLLEIEEAPVEGRGGYAQGFGGTPDRAVTDDGIEIDIEPRRPDAAQARGRRLALVGGLCSLGGLGLGRRHAFDLQSSPTGKNYDSFCREIGGF